MNHKSINVQNGFSLFEMLIVVIIVSIIAAWTVPAIIPALQSKSLNAESDEFEQTLNNARQIAMAEDVVVDIELIAIQPENGERGQFTGYRFWKWLPSGDKVAIGAVHWLNPNFVFSSQYSTILKDGGSERETGQLVKVISGSVEVIRFSIYPNGETNLPERADTDNWHLTISSAENTTELDRNFVCFQINQTNSHVTKYRP